MSILLRYNKMNSLLHVIVVTFCALSVFVLSYANIVYSQPISIDSLTSSSSRDLKSKMDNLIADKLNNSAALLNSSTILTNDSNLTSTQMVISNNKIMSTTSGNDSATGNSLIKDKVTVTNGVCHSERLGGNGDDILTSSGNCDDQLTGGPGADKFTCGEGNDTITDYNKEEGDVIIDQQNCEKVL